MDDMNKEFLLDENITFLNHGSFGSCPKPIFREYQEWQKKLEKQPVQFLTKDLYSSLRDSRVALSDFIGCNNEDLLFFENPTTAISNVMYSLDLDHHDEVLMTNHEYGALVRAWNKWNKRNTFFIRQQTIELPIKSEEQFLENFWEGVNEKTRVIFISHITSPTAIIFPIKKIIKRAKENGILTIIDGAHVPGHISLNISELDCDFYTGALHKWLCAPKGSSFLYVKKDHQNWLKPIIYSWGKYGDDPGPTEFLQDFQWQGTRDLSSFLTIPTSIKFYNNQIKPYQDKCKKMCLDTYKRLMSILNTMPITKGEKWIGQMVSHPLPKDIPSNLKEILWNEHKIEIPIFNWEGLDLIRCSIQVYNKDEDIDSLIKALESI